MIDYKLHVNDMLNADTHFNTNLACAIGQNGAILLGAINYLVKLNSTDRKVTTHKHQDQYGNWHWWAYRTIPEWCDEFPFMSESVVKRTLESLRNLKLVNTGKFNRMPTDHTLWYTVDHEAVYTMMEIWNLQGRPKRADTGAQSPAYSAFIERYLDWLGFNRSVSDQVTVTLSNMSPRPDQIRSPRPDVIPEEEEEQKPNKNTPAGGIDGKAKAKAESEDTTEQEYPSLFEEEKEINKEEKEATETIEADNKLLQYNPEAGSYDWIARISKTGATEYLKTPKPGYDRYGNKRGGFNKTSSSFGNRNNRAIPNARHEPEQKTVYVPEHDLEALVIEVLREHGNNKKLVKANDFSEFFKTKLKGLDLSPLEIYQQNPARFEQYLIGCAKRAVPEDGILGKQQFLNLVVAGLREYLNAGTPTTPQSEGDFHKKYAMNLGPDEIAAMLGDDNG